ncbi:MAG TPA: sulfotransferase [Candidatus Baltobacteraceae bacterium]|jgi:tetratricopeptide (TPR) repeat protein|nr:sulfotransferase [Candidatus Baltobacteraceae bacterium]
MGQTLQADLARLEKSPQDLARWQKAQQQLLAGKAALALPAYRDLVKRFPGVVNLWFEFGAAAAADLAFEPARQAFDHAEQMAGADSAVLIALGQQYHRLRQPARARVCFERAAQVAPSSSHARLSWAAWLERERRLEDAWEQTEACLTQNPRDAAALYYRAFLLYRKGRADEAQAQLRDLIQSDAGEPGVKISSLHLLAVVLDELGQYAEAMEWLLKAKALTRQHNNVPALEQTYEKAARRRRSLLAGLTPDMIRRWRSNVPASASPRKLALLGGHPRSGTTLLEQILGANPSIAAFDESDAFVVEIGDRLFPADPFPPLTAAALDALSPARQRELKGRYFKSLFREVEGEPAAEVLIDKNPTPTASLPLWLRMFPDSKVIIALRDPRDVVISCFFQNLALTPMNANFLGLDRAVQHYADLMDVWLRVRELGGFDWIETRYEDIVASAETEGRRVTEFLGLTWYAAQANCHEAARERFVFSPTYSEVAKPVHNRAVGRWKHYAAALEPFNAKFSVYLQAFGYADS